MESSYYSKATCGRFLKPLAGFFLAAGGVSPLILLANGEQPVVLGGPEVVKIDWGIRAITPADIDGDGRLDLLVANNDAARIELLYQREPGAPATLPQARRTRDRWEPVVEDGRFERDSHVTGMNLFDLAAGDWNGDGFQDIAFTGNADPLTILYADGEGGWEEPWVFRRHSAVGWPTSLLKADFNDDGRDDLIALGMKEILLFCGLEEGGLDEPQSLRFAGSSPHKVHLMDYNQDGHRDLAFLTESKDRYLNLRLADGQGGFGPEIRFRLELDVTAFELLDEAEGRPRFATIERRTHRLRVASLHPGDGPVRDLEGLLARTYATDAEARSAALYARGDFDGDGLEDLVVGDPAASRFLYFRQIDDGAFAEGVDFPSLAGLSALVAWRPEGGDRDHLAMLGAEEELVGLTHLNAAGRFPFPKLLPIEGEPLALGVLATAQPQLLLATRDDDGLKLLGLDPSSPEEAVFSIDLGKTRRDPRMILSHQLAGEQPGVMILMPREPVRIFLADEKEGLREVAVEDNLRKSFLDDVDSSRLGLGDLDADGREEILLASDGYVRALSLTGEAFEVRDQFNLRSGGDAAHAPVLVDLDGDEQLDLLVLVKGDEPQWQWLAADELGVFRFRDSQPAGPVDFLATQTFAHTAGGRPAILATGTDRFWIYPLDEPGWEWTVEETYETDLEGMTYGRLATGDLNGDGLRDVVLIDGREHLAEFLVREPKGGFRSSLHFAVFDENLHYQGRRGNAFEPREAIIADFTDDGREDLLFLIHDRLLLYPQGDPVPRGQQ